MSLEEAIHKGIFMKCLLNKSKCFYFKKPNKATKTMCCFKSALHTYIHTLLLPPQRGFSGTLNILHYL